MNPKPLFRLTFIVCLFLSATTLSAQDYKTAVGIGVAIGNEAGLAGPTIKHFFSEKSAVHADVLFESDVTLTHLIYQHHMPVKGSTGLKFFTGGGPGLEFYESEIDFLLALMAGLEYKIKKAPVAISGNWQPTLHFGDLRETLQPVRFGLGLKLAF